ncbi:glycosyltransferase family 2 protein [Eubacterium maltosivorans]|uniref:Glycosyltransferase n=1 Tax=Eubacterium maltosivorans TaxID=2041044 RepID=A0A2A5T8E0_EUBML|nr:glycosyltransferase family 2 protein [Eubacterium maltosivorans]QCT71585.1 glycosyltransferase [Eubacterium maltosivorans]
MKGPKTLYLVIPCYNEEQVLNITAETLKDKIENLKERNIISKESRILFVNDGSKDQTWSIIERLCNKNSLYQGIKLSRNEGHQNAVLAGLMTAKAYCDMAISLDADLQDDIDVIDQFVDEYYDGNDIVYGVRSKRDADTFFKRFSAESFYKLLKSFGVEIVYNHADYRLMSKRALEGLAQFKEVNLFLRGIVPLIGYPSSVVTYERHERFAGESKYPLKKMLSLAFDGITSFSIKPIRMISIVGVVSFLVSVGILVYSLIMNYLGQTITGWTSLACSIWALGGVQLLAIGIIGEYIGKIYNETKERPKYFIETFLKN